MSLTNKELDFTNTEPLPPAHYLKSLAKLFAEVAPDATEKQKKRLADLSKSILDFDIKTKKKIQENQDRKIAEQREKALSWTEEYEKIMKLGATKVVTEELVMSLHEQHQNLLSEVMKVDEELAELRQKLAEQKKIEADTRMESRRAHNIKLLELNSQLADLQLELCLK